MSKQFWGVIALIVVIFVGIAIASGNGSDSNGSNKSSEAKLSQHVEGNNSAGVTLVEYGDYQCPYCGQYYPTVKQIAAEFNDQIHFQFRNYPLVNLHQNAFAAARAAEAAALQNKYWEMHDMLYEQQNTWSSATDPMPYFKQYASQIGLKTDQFATDYASSKVNDIINADKSEGDKLGITGTPTFYLDGKKVDVGNSAADFEKVLKDAIAKKGVKSSGTTSQTTEPAASTDTTTPAQ